MRFHVVSLPHTQVTKDFTGCAFTEKVRRFCIMMTNLGHEVYLYAGEQVDAPVTKLITCISEERRAQAVGNAHYTQASFDTNALHWRIFNTNVIRLMQSHLQPQDFICLIGGYAHKEIADKYPNHISVEFGVASMSTLFGTKQHDGKHHRDNLIHLPSDQTENVKALIEQLTQSRLQAVSASSGGGTTDPTVVGLASDIAGEGEQQALMQFALGENRARGREMQAEASRMSGQAAQTGSYFSAMGGLLSGGSSLYTKYRGYR